MAATGLGFGTATRFVPLVVVGFVGTLNPTAGDVSLFLPSEQAVLADLTDTARRPHLFALYNVGAALAAALGALASALPDRVARSAGWNIASTERHSFLIYLVTSVGAACLYAGMRDIHLHQVTQRRLHRSRPIVVRARPGPSSSPPGWRVGSVSCARWCSPIFRRTFA